MTATDGWLCAVVLLGTLWLLWNGRANSPRRQRDQARWDALLAQALRDQRDGGGR